MGASSHRDGGRDRRHARGAQIRSCQDRSAGGSLISTHGKKQRTGKGPHGRGPQKPAKGTDGKDLEALEEGQELDQEKAKNLQGGIGNQGLLNLLNRSADEAAESASLEIEVVEEEGQALDEEQETDKDEAREGTAVDTGGPPGGVPPDDAPLWGTKELGGDDDTPSKPPRRRRPTRRRGPPPPDLPDDPIPEGDSVADGPERGRPGLDDISLSRPDTLLGDEVHDALWGWLQDPASAARAPLEPEDLGGLAATHPISRCRIAGDFLAEHGPSPLSRALGQLGRPLPGPPALSGQVARAAALVTLSQAVAARSTGVQPANRSVSLVLEDDALPHARRVAWELAQQGKMWAPAIFERCIGPLREDPLDLAGRGAGPAGRALLAAALGQVAGPGGRHEVPPCPRPVQVVVDDDLAWVDEAMAGATGRGDRETRLTYELLNPVLLGIRSAVRTAAKLQVELAAAATSAWRVAGETVRLRLRGVLRALWRELGIVARAAMAMARELEAKVGRPLGELLPLLDRADALFGPMTERLRDLRTDGLAALAAMLARSTRSDPEPRR